MAHKLFLFNFLLLHFIVATCNSIEPPPDGQGINLTLEDVSSIEAWIKLTTTNLQLPITITLKQNDQTIRTINLNKVDTLLNIDSLLPNTAYNFKASSIEHQVSSNQLQITTLDTTSQNFTFETYEFGDGYSSSYFNDVFMFNENDIWVCGNVFANDSTDGNLYRWNGNYWEAIRLNFVDMEGIWGIDSILYLASGGVWRYDRVNLIRQDIEGIFSQGQAVHKLWGSSENNIWGVGPEGTVVHYNGSSWKKVEFDTQWIFKEVTGNPETGTAYAVARNISFTTILVEFKSNTEPEIIYNSDVSNISIDSNTLMIVKNRHLFLGLKQIGRFDLATNDLEMLYEVPPLLGISEMSNAGVNDMYFFGTWVSEGQKLLHYNGVRYNIFDLTSNTGIIYGGSHTINGITILGGMWNNRAFLIKVKRN